MARLNVEDFLDENASSEPVNVDDIILKTEGTYEKSEEVTESLEVMAELTGIALALEDIASTVQTYGIKDKGSMIYVHQSIQSQLSRMGLEHLYIKPSFEGYEDLSEKEIVASLENMIAKIWNAVADKGSKAWKALSDFFKDFYEDIHEIAAKAEALQRDLAKREDTAATQTLDISQAHYLHIAGRTDKDAIIKGFENLCKVVQTSFPSYIENVKKFYDRFFKAMQQIAGRVDWLEGALTRGKVVDEFLKDVNKDMNTMLDSDKGQVEFSGGRIFATRNLVIESLPELLKKSPNLKVDSHATIQMPSKKEIDHMLDLIISNASVVNSYWKRWNDMLEVLSKARADAAEDSANIDNWRILKLISRVDTHLAMTLTHGNIMNPLNLMAWHTLHVSRSLLKLNERAIEHYRPKI